MTKCVYPNRVDFNRAVEIKPLQIEFAHHLPDVPVQPETLLLMDLEIQESTVDLRVISQLVLNDLGATVQIMRLAALEYGQDEGCPTRIEDCISDLGVGACMDAISMRTVNRDCRHRAIAEIWAHSREIAKYSRAIAERTPKVNPDEAYLVGLFHAIGLLPSVLGWDSRETSAGDNSLIGFELARKWSLPCFVLEFFRAALMNSSATPWLEIVREAHWSASRQSIQYAHLDEVRTRLLHLV
jgi:HD-like signal output (HDOD) protein